MSLKAVPTRRCYDFGALLGELSLCGGLSDGNDDR